MDDPFSQPFGVDTHLAKSMLIWSSKSHLMRALRTPLALLTERSILRNVAPRAGLGGYVMLILWKGNVGSAGAGSIQIFQGDRDGPRRPRKIKQYKEEY